MTVALSFSPLRFLRSFCGLDFEAFGKWRLQSRPPSCDSAEEALFMKRALKSMPQLRIYLLAFLLLITGALRNAYCLGQVGPPSATNSNSAQPPEQKSTPSSKLPPGLPPCPSQKFLPMRQLPPSNASHKVILSWNPSEPSPDHPSKTVGYCLYKSRTKIDPNQPICSTCEPLNAVPVTGTSCTDDIVENDVTYFYVASAVNAAGTPSRWSNVTIPSSSSSKTSSVPASSPPPPLCRGASATK